MRGPRRRVTTAATRKTGTSASAGNLIPTPIAPIAPAATYHFRDARSMPRNRHSTPAETHARSGTSSIKFIPATTAGPSSTQSAATGAGRSVRSPRRYSAQARSTTQGIIAVCNQGMFSPAMAITRAKT